MDDLWVWVELLTGIRDRKKLVLFIEWGAANVMRAHFARFYLEHCDLRSHLWSLSDE